MARTAANVVGNNAPRIAERAATPGRVATEGGDERASTKSGHPFRTSSRTPRA
jgi:hypothetical protein